MQISLQKKMFTTLWTKRPVTAASADVPPTKLAPTENFVHAAHPPSYASCRIDHGYLPLCKSTCNRRGTRNCGNFGKQVRRRRGGAMTVRRAPPGGLAKTGAAATGGAQ